MDHDQKPYFKPYAETMKYVAFSPEDAQKILEAAGLTGHQKAVVMRYFTRVQEVAMAASQ